MNFDELLVRFKAQARPEDALVPVLDPALLLYAAVWPRVRVVIEGDPADESWDALWACVKVDTESLAMLVDAPVVKAAAVHRRLVALRLIYPDGTVPEIVRNVIGKRVKDALKN